MFNGKSTRALSWHFLLLCLCWLVSPVIEAASISVQLINNSSSTYDYQRQGRANSTLAWGGPINGILNPNTTNAAAVVDATATVGQQIRVVGRDDDLGSIMYIRGAAPGETVYTYVGPGDETVIFEVVNTSEVEWCYKIKVINSTAFSQTYGMFQIEDNSPLGPSVTVPPGGQTLLSLGPEPSKFDFLAVQIMPENAQYLGDGVYADMNGAPLWRLEVLAGDSLWYDCDGTALTNGVNHYYNGPGLDPSLTLGGTNAAIQFDSTATNDVNVLKQGFEALASSGIQGMEKTHNLLQGLNQGSSNQLAALEGIQNTLGAIATNTAAGTNDTTTNQYVAGEGTISTNVGSMASAALEASAGVSNGLYGVAQDLGTITNFSGLIDGPDPSTYWAITLPNSILSQAGWQHEISFNPMDIPLFADVAGWARVLISWASCTLFIRFVLRQIQDAIWAQGNYQQGGAPNIGTTIAGIGFQSSLFLHLPIWTIITSVLVVIGGIATTFLSSSGALSTALINPFDTDVTAIKAGLWLFGQFVDAYLLLTHFILGLVLHIVLGVHGLVTSIIIRAMPSCIAFGLFLASQATVQAGANVTLENYAGTNAVVSWLPGTALQLPQGGKTRLDGVTSDIVIGAETWINPFAVGDGEVSLLVLDDGSGGFALVYQYADTVEQSFYLGLKLGGLYLGLQITVWLVRLLKTRNQEAVV